MSGDGLNDLVTCLACESGPFDLNVIRAEYDRDHECYAERCPSCQEGHALAWVVIA